MTEDWEASVPTARRAPQHVRLFSPDDAYEHLYILTLLPSLGPLHLMLADALSPHGSNATLASVGTLSEGFERFVTSPLYLVGYVRWDARSDQSSFVKQSLQQLSGRNPRRRLRDNFASRRPQPPVQSSSCFRITSGFPSLGPTGKTSALNVFNCEIATFYRK
jgi:hypothetical protein